MLSNRKRVMLTLRENYESYTNFMNQRMVFLKFAGRFLAVPFFLVGAVLLICFYIGPYVLVCAVFHCI
jgi:hypothetical protein